MYEVRQKPFYPTEKIPNPNGLYIEVWKDGKLVGVPGIAFGKNEASDMTRAVRNTIDIVAGGEDA